MLKKYLYLKSFLKVKLEIFACEWIIDEISSKSEVIYKFNSNILKSISNRMKSIFNILKFIKYKR